MGGYIWITTSFAGKHCWPSAPEHVFFLRSLHRHLFTVKVYIEVFHNEREVEFITFKSYINKFTGFDENQEASCETFSDLLYEYIVKEYPGRRIIIEVGEDGENGSRKEYE